MLASFIISDDKKCSTTQDENNCIIEFKYKKLERKNKDSNQRVDEIYVLKKKTCPEKLSPLKVGMNVGVGIIAVGLLTAILWRLITFYHDRAEYERFKKELDAAKWQGVSVCLSTFTLSVQGMDVSNLESNVLLSHFPQLCDLVL